jgi:hypothetical protein
MGFLRNAYYGMQYSQSACKGTFKTVRYENRRDLIIFIKPYNIRRARGLEIDPQLRRWGYFTMPPTEPCALGSTQPLKVSTRKLVGVKTAGM